MPVAELCKLASPFAEQREDPAQSASGGQAMIDMKGVSAHGNPGSIQLSTKSTGCVLNA